MIAPFRKWLPALFPALQCLLQAAAAYAQPAEAFLFEPLTIPGVISQSAANTMLQDRQGFLWFGTWSGLARYDGYDIRVFNQGPQNTLASSKVTCLLEDRAGRLWVGTRNTGLYCFDRATERFTPAREVFGAQGDLPDQNITSVFEDRDGRFWIGTEGGLYRFDPVQKQFLVVPLRGETPPPSENQYLYAIAQTSDGSIWIGGSYGLFCGVAAGDGIPVFRQAVLHPPDADPLRVEFHNFVYDVLPDARAPGVLWVATKQGLKRATLRPGSYGFAAIERYEHRPGDPNSISHNFATAVLSADFPEPGAIWVATFNGLNLFLPAENRWQRFLADARQPFSLASNNVRCLYEDRTGILWVGTDKGAQKLNPRSRNFNLASFYRGTAQSRDAVACLDYPGRNMLWVGTFGGGLYGAPVRDGRPAWQNARRYAFDLHFAAPVTDFISAIVHDSAGQIWVATQGAGVFRFSEKNLPSGGGLIRPVERWVKGNGPAHLSDDYVMSAWCDRDGALWLGCWDGGLNYFDPLRQTFSSFVVTSDGRADFQKSPVVALCESNSAPGRQRLWAGTRGAGLYELEFERASGRLLVLRHLNVNAQGDDFFENQFITGFFTDSKGRFWVTAENGLNVCYPGQKRFVKVWRPGLLPNSFTQAMAEDGQGRLWVSTQSGMACLIEGENGIFQSISYDGRNGLRDRFFNNNAMLGLPGGLLLAGGNNGVTWFDPEPIHADPAPPQVSLTGLRLFNHPVSVGERTAEGFLLPKNLLELGELVLPYDQNVVSFEFTGLHFSCPEQNRFAYQLEGFDKDWSYTGAAQRLAHYTNLPPGRYVFLVKAANSDGVWNSEPARLNVRVLPPWWRTSWAYALYGLAFLSLLYGVRRITLLRANYENRLALERVEKEKLNEVNQLKLIFFTNISHELKTPLTLIISPLEELIKNRGGDRMLHSTFTRMHRNAARLQTMINQLLDIRKAEAGLMRLEASEANVVQFAGEIFISFRELARQKQIDFRFDPEKSVIRAWFDPDQLEKVLFNLLSNAFKYTPQKGSVRMSLGEDAAQQALFIRVSDTGKGIPPDKLSFIFERFYRADEHHEQAGGGGTGIGLSLVKTIVEQHSGRIEVDSRPGQGSAFTIWLPLGEAHFTAEQKKHSPAHGETLEEYHLPPEEPLPEAVDAMPVRKLKIASNGEKPLLLLVEDNEDIRAYLRENLAEEYQLVEAADGDAGLRQALEHSPDLVLCDVAMPGMDGIALTRQLKTRMETSHIPVVLLTARTSLIFKIDGLETGADDYVTKPFNLQLLKIRIHNLIESRRKLREKYGRNIRRLEVEPSEIALPSLDEEFLKKVLEITESNLEDAGFSVDDLARKLFLNRRQVYRKIKALTDQTPNELIRAIRLKRAAQLLKTHHYTVAEVTYKVGFQDLKYFRERFREMFGMSPSEYENGEEE